MAIMKICILSEREYGCGASIAAFRLAEALGESGHEVHYVFCYPHPGAESRSICKRPLRQRRSSGERKIYGLLHRMSPKMGMHYRFHMNYKELNQLLKTIDPDIINLHNVGTILRHDAVMALGYSYPIVWTMHDCFAIKPYAYQFVNRLGNTTETVCIDPRFVDRQAQHRMLVSSSNIHFVTPSRWMRNSLLPQLKARDSIHTIPNGLSTQTFFPEDKSSSRKLLGLSENGFYLLFVASNLEYERKNIRALLDALELLRDRSIGVMALGNATLEFKNRYQFIRFFESVGDSGHLRRLYSAADLFVVTSLIDNLPNTVMESLFCGTPVVGANVGGIPEMVVPGETGWLFDPRQPDELANTISCIRQESGLLSKISQRCVVWVREHFSIEKQRDQYLQLFRQVRTTFTADLTKKR